MSAHAEPHVQPHGEAPGHHRNYVKIWAILTGLLVVSVLGPMVGIRMVTLIAAFGIALVKAYLVAKNSCTSTSRSRSAGCRVALILMVVLTLASRRTWRRAKGRTGEDGRLPLHEPAGLR
jgi:hypothetical protein